MENRKEIDFDLITSAARKKPRTFTELLHITKLSRKTLSLRLKELCSSGVLVKREGMYNLNGSAEFRERDFAKGFSRMLYNGKIRVGLLLIAFLLSSSISGYALATLFMQSPGRQALGSFTMNLDVSNVQDLIAWQVAISFDSSGLEVTEITPGEALGVDYPFFLESVVIDEGVLLLGGAVDPRTATSGKDISDTGTLAVIVFDYYVEQYQDPAIVLKVGVRETYLLDSQGSLIFEGDTTLEHLQLVEIGE